MALRGLGRGGTRGGGDWKTVLSRTLLGAAATLIAGWLDKKIDRRRLSEHPGDHDNRNQTESESPPIDAKPRLPADNGKT